MYTGRVKALYHMRTHWNRDIRTWSHKRWNCPFKTASIDHAAPPPPFGTLIFPSDLELLTRHGIWSERDPILCFIKIEFKKLHAWLFA